MNGKIRKISPTPQGSLTTVPMADAVSFEANTYISDFVKRGDEVWIATDRGLYRYNKKKNTVKRYENNPGNPSSLSQNYLTDLALTPNNQLIVATLRGVNIYNPAIDGFERIAYNLQNGGTNLLNSNFINCILADGDNIWFGTETGGINKLNPRDWQSAAIGTTKRIHPRFRLIR